MREGAQPNAGAQEAQVVVLRYPPGTPSYSLPDLLPTQLPAAITSAIVEPAIVVGVGKEPPVIDLKQFGQLGWVKRLHGARYSAPAGLLQELAGTAQETRPMRRRIVAAARCLQGSLGIVVATWRVGLSVGGAPDVPAQPLRQSVLYSGRQKKAAPIPGRLAAER